MPDHTSNIRSPSATRHSGNMSFPAAQKARLKSRLQIRTILDNAVVSWLMGTAYLGAGAVRRNPARKLRLLVSGTRRLQGGVMLETARRLLRPWLEPGQVDAWRRHRIGWERYHGGFADVRKDKALKTSLLLKEPGENGEKGILYCSFESNWMKLVVNHDARRLFQDYILVGASSWSPSDHSVLGNLCGLSEDPAFIGISNPSDIAQYQLFSPHIRSLRLMACDWVDPRDFNPLPHQERSIDLLLVAHFAYWKRHRLLFQALRKMRKDLRVVLIGRTAPGRGEQELMDEARAFGVPQDLRILSHLEIDEVMRHQCNARVSLALSKREGSCVSVTEAMFADSPVAVMHDAHIGARAHINARTGRVLRPAEMAHGLSEMIEKSGNYSARDWAMENIAADISSRKLNETLKQHCLAKGLPWTRDITPICWRYVPRYLNPLDEARMEAGVKRLRMKHGLVLEEFVSERAAMKKAG